MHSIRDFNIQDFNMLPEQERVKRSAKKKPSGEKHSFKPAHYYCVLSVEPN